MQMIQTIQCKQIVARKWSIVNDSSKVNYNAGNESTYNKEVLKYNLCDYNDAYILVKGGINVPAAPEMQIRFKNCVLFTKCITKIDGIIIDDVED